MLVPAVMLAVLLCCLACTHRRCWCCGLCDGGLSADQVGKMFDRDGDKDPLIV